MILNINKPAGMTSHDVVDEIRSITGVRRVGHGGTLDPFATGVLIIGVSREFTKKLDKILKNTDKEYEATLVLGKTSTTGDPEGEITTSGKIDNNITENKIKETLKKFEGEIEQIPPIYSAIKIDGTRAYKRARRGEEISLKKRTVNIMEIELMSTNLPEIKIRTVVSSGTYIRSLAQDIGITLGVGAYLEELTRTRVGKFTLENSKTLEKLKGEWVAQ